MDEISSPAATHDVHSFYLELEKAASWSPAFKQHMSGRELQDLYRRLQRQAPPADDAFQPEAGGASA